MKMLTISDISFTYPGADKEALKDINFQAKKGKILAVVGESGSGKSTLLDAIYGKIDLSKGQIWFQDQEIKGPRYNLLPGHDQMKYVTQKMDLVTYATVFDNIGKYISNVDVERKKRRIQTILDAVDLGGYQNTLIKNLSGGQKQRVALAQSVANIPQLLLLDEPFSNIDNILKQKIRDRLFDIFRAFRLTVIFSTHDMQDALGFSDEILIIKDGQRVQYDTPEAIYQKPKDLYVARLFGYANFFTSAESEAILGEPKEQILFPHQLNLDQLIGEVRVMRKMFLGKETLLKVRVKDKIIFVLQR